jgi:hypothetical protein
MFAPVTLHFRRHVNVATVEIEAVGSVATGPLEGDLAGSGGFADVVNLEAAVFIAVCPLGPQDWDIGLLYLERDGDLGIRRGPSQLALEGVFGFQQLLRLAEKLAAVPLGIHHHHIPGHRHLVRVEWLSESSIRLSSVGRRGSCTSMIDVP